MQAIPKVHPTFKAAKTILARVQETVEIEVIQHVGAAVKRVGEVKGTHGHVVAQVAKGLIDVARGPGLLDRWRALIVLRLLLLLLLLVGELLRLLLGCGRLIAVGKLLVLVVGERVGV